MGDEGGAANMGLSWFEDPEAPGPQREKGTFASDIRVCVLTKIQCLITFSY